MNTNQVALFPEIVLPTAARRTDKAVDETAPVGHAAVDRLAKFQVAAA